jgi:hypothetical protein
VAGIGRGTTSPMRWSETRAKPVHFSRIGLLIHPYYGLWHSYRGALGLTEELAVPEQAPVTRSDAPPRDARER